MHRQFKTYPAIIKHIEFGAYDSKIDVIRINEFTQKSGVRIFKMAEDSITYLPYESLYGRVSLSCFGFSEYNQSA